MNDDRPSRRAFLHRSLRARAACTSRLLSAASACAVHHAPIEANDIGWDRVPASGPHRAADLSSARRHHVVWRMPTP
jgi:hypothetical protein